MCCIVLKKLKGNKESNIRIRGKKKKKDGFMVNICDGIIEFLFCFVLGWVCGIRIHLIIFDT